MLKSATIARLLHKWLGLLVGIQILIWLASGLYMVIVDIDFIRGDPLVRNTQQVVNVPQDPVLGMNSLMTRHPDATRIDLEAVMGRPHYIVTTPADRYLYEPQTGERLSPLPGETVKQIARYHSALDAPVRGATLIVDDPPTEIQNRPLPLWRVDFGDRLNTSFYIDPDTGALVTRRHQYWRIFDFLWMLHIMDYDERKDTHHPLLIFAQSTGLCFVITGLWLLFHSFRGRNNEPEATH